jgi:uncharacterized membrane protein
MKKTFSILFSVLAALYPVLVFLALVILRIPIRLLSLCIAAVAFVFFLSFTNEKKRSGPIGWKSVAVSAFFIAAGLLCYFSNKTIFLKLYSVVVNITLLIVFGSTLFFPPNIIFRFATLQDKSIKGSATEKKVRHYCRTVTVVWCTFFILNGLVAGYTVFFCSDKIWSIYNGGISYLLMGFLFAAEYLVRKRVQKKLAREDHRDTPVGKGVETGNKSE